MSNITITNSSLTTSNIKLSSSSANVVISDMKITNNIFATSLGSLELLALTSLTIKNSVFADNNIIQKSEISISQFKSGIVKFENCTFNGILPDATQPDLHYK